MLDRLGSHQAPGNPRVGVGGTASPALASCERFHSILQLTQPQAPQEGREAAHLADSCQLGGRIWGRQGITMCKY